MGEEVLVVGLGLLPRGVEDQWEPRAWELGHGLSRENGCAGKPPPQACLVSPCPLARALGRDHSGAHTLRLASVLAFAAGCCLVVVLVVLGLAGFLVELGLGPRTDPENGFACGFAGVFLGQSTTMGCRR